MKPIRTALLSFGMSGKIFHAPFLHCHPYFELYAVWERSKQAAVATYPSIKTFQTLEALLGDDTIDLVIVNTPTGLHYEHAKQALQAGKHVVVEKAFTTTLAEAISLEQIANQQGKKIAVFQNRRWDSDFLTVQKQVQEGKLGNICEAEFHFDRFKPQLSPKAHKETPGAGAGLLKDLGPHLIDQALCLFGMPGMVFADCRITRAGSQVDDYFDILLYYPTMRVRLKSGYLVREAMPAYMIHGDKGSFIKSRSDRQEARLLAKETPDAPDWGEEPLSDQGLLHTEWNGETIRKHIPTEKGNYLQFYDQVAKALSSNEPMPVTAQDGINCMRIIEAAIASDAQAKTIRIGIKK